jgi:hypothetical protein
MTGIEYSFFTDFNNELFITPDDAVHGSTPDTGVCRLVPESIFFTTNGHT